MVAEAGISRLDRAQGPRRRRILESAKSGLDLMPDKLISATFAHLRKRGNESILTLPEFRKRRSVTLSAHFDVSRIVETWKCLGFGSFRRFENSQKVRLSRQRFC